MKLYHRYHQYLNHRYLLGENTEYLLKGMKNILKLGICADFTDLNSDGLIASEGMKQVLQIWNGRSQYNQVK